jgi:ABC-type transport system substrate-binding protein
MDIPIVKEGSAYRSLPIGSGPYEFHEDESGTYLSPNPCYPGAADLPVQRIELKYFPVEELASAFAAGELDLLVSDPGVMSQSTFEGGVRRNLPTTVFYYLGINPACEPLSDPARRRLVNAAINRGSLSGILGGDATLVPLHPLLPEADDAAARVWLPTDLGEYCIEILTEDYDEDGVLEYFRDGVPTDFSFRLLVCSENEAGTAAARSIADDLKNKGIRAELRLVNETDFLQAVKNRDYDMFLGSMRLTADFDLTPLYGAYGDDMLLKLAQDLRASEGEERALIASELCAYSAECCRLIPLIYQRRVIYFRQGSVRETDPSWTDPFRNIAGWTTAG